MYFNYWTSQKLIARLNYVILKSRPGDYTTSFHNHIYNEILYLDHGKMKVSLGKNEFILNPGECIFIPSRKKHIVCGANKKTYNFLNIGYRGRVPIELTNMVHTLCEKTSIVIRELKEISQPPLSSIKAEIASNKLTEFILLLCEQLQENTKNEGRTPVNRRHYRSDIVNKAIEIIQDSYNIQLKAEDIASQVGVSCSQLRALLRKETGKSFMKHLQAVRIEEAKNLIQEGNDNINSIAFKVGYDSQPFFFKIFRRHTGMTPLEFAKTLGSPDNFKDR
ncbi:MAG: helix-turn-helix domain-containing protein [Planctomycetota bacterium]|jgi:YesN/AraC family two-component response regulator